MSKAYKNQAFMVTSYFTNAAPKMIPAPPEEVEVEVVYNLDGEPTSTLEEFVLTTAVPSDAEGNQISMTVESPE